MKNEAVAPNLSGSIVPLVSPLTQDETLDKSSLRRLFDFHRTNTTDAIFLLGTCGEGPCLRERVKQELVAVASEEADGFPLLVGVSETASRRAAEWARCACQWDVRLVVMPPTFQFVSSTEEHVAHVRSVVDAVGEPVILYNLPSRSGGFPIPVEAIRNLLEDGSVVGIKDSGGNLDYQSQLLSLRTEFAFFRVLNGDLACAGDAVLQGADGLVMSYTNVDPAGCAEMIHAARAGREDTVNRLQDRFMQVRHLFPRSATPAAWAKSILAAQGLCKPTCCTPARSIEPFLPEVLKEQTHESPSDRVAGL